MCPPTPHPTTTTPTMLPTTFPSTTMQHLSTMFLFTINLSKSFTQQSAKMCLLPPAVPTHLPSNPLISLTLQQLLTQLLTLWLTLWSTL